MSEQEFSQEYLDPGDNLFNEGDTGDAAYLIKSGQIEITTQAGYNERKVIATLGKGNIIGEMAMIDDKPRAATATCIESATVVVVTKDSLKKRLERTDPVVMQLLNTFTRRLREQAISIANMKSESP